MWKPDLENGNVNGFGTNVQVVFDNGVTLNEFSRWSNLANMFTSTCCVGTDFVELKPFTRIFSFWPAKFKRCARPARTNEWVQQDSHITRAVVTSVCELISNRSTGYVR